MSKTSSKQNRRINRDQEKQTKTVTSVSSYQEILGILILVSDIFITFSLVSFLFEKQWMGPFGKDLAWGLYRGIGVCSIFVSVIMGTIAIRLLFDKKPLFCWQESVSLLFSATSISMLFHNASSTDRINGFGLGGIVGEIFAETLNLYVSVNGTLLVAITGLIVALMLVVPFRVKDFAKIFLSWINGLKTQCQMQSQKITPMLQRLVKNSRQFVGEVFPRKSWTSKDLIEETDSKQKTMPQQSDTVIEDEPVWARSVGEDAEDTEDAEYTEDAGKAEEAEKSEENDGQVVQPMSNEETEPVEKLKQHKQVRINGVEQFPSIERNITDNSNNPTIVESQFQKPAAKELEAKDPPKTNKANYKTPSIKLLDYDEASSPCPLDRQVMIDKAERLEKSLKQYGVIGKVSEIRPGPVVTMYEFSPEPGTRINKVVNLTDDLAMSLGAMRVRIAPIPGKTVIGIEVPNEEREMVYLKEVIADDVFQQATHSLPLALGKDIDGGPVAVDLAKMPHLLVAGTTGSGKSVAVNTMILSILYSLSPEEVRLILVDPKMLELSIYEGVPHLLLPVVTNPKKASCALLWAVAEMERRYKWLSIAGVRDIGSYNKSMTKNKPRSYTDDATGEEIQLPDSLARIVIVIDEFADLMMCAPKEVETSVARIAQKARAAGIHLIIATQRPSVDVITGLIKANFPSRMAFQVSSKIDSRTILDQVGAESLLGSGDMLFSDRGADLRRVHGCFVSDEEVHRIVAFIHKQGEPVYDLDILKQESSEKFNQESDEDNEDEMYDQAVALVAETQRASVSLVQRKLRIGYNRAARLVDQMEQEGIVSAAGGAGRREVLIDSVSAISG